MITHSFLAAAYAEMGRNQDAEGERAIILRRSPFFDARIFSAQYGTSEARDHPLEGLRRQDSLNAARIREISLKLAEMLLLINY